MRDISKLSEKRQRKIISKLGEELSKGLRHGINKTLEQVEEKINYEEFYNFIKHLVKNGNVDNETIRQKIEELERRKYMKKCKFLQNINKRDSWIEAKFYGVFQYSTILKESFMVGGLSGGVIAYPVAIVEDENGLQQVELYRVKEIENEKGV